MTWASEDLLAPVKLWLRISSSKMDDELEQTIDACKLDLQNSGVKNLDSADPLVRQAVKLYCKAQFGYDDSAGKFTEAYEHLKAALSLSGDYNVEGGLGMYFTDEITLIAYDETQDEIGNWVKTPVETEAFCSVSSVTRAEFFDAGRNGMKPDCVATMRKCDYDGQTEVELNGKRLHVYRTYANKPDMVELHLEETANGN